ncbi:MAG: hypothetical protein N4A74_11300 [Carboxylicivirga sp.]|jgi:hypothetical protein|nr:hypothetical protein [Carboxylicivirga sp.]
MSYSNNIAEWAGSAISGTQYGWMGQRWTARTNNTKEPDPDNTADWQLDSPVQFFGFGIAEVQDPKDYLYVKFTGFGIAEEHVNRPPEVKLFGFGIVQNRPKSFFHVVIID